MRYSAGPNRDVVLLPSLLVILAAAFAVALARLVLGRRAEQECARRLPRGPEGIIVGAEPFELAGGGSRAVLLLHGFGDTPQSLRYLADDLRSHGWTVRVPLLPGHGRTLHDFASSRADDWLAHARRELHALNPRFDTVALCGLSMGGALAVMLAAESPTLPALALIAPYLRMRGSIRAVARAHPLVGVVTRYIRGRGDRSIRDPVEAARTLGYGYATPRLLAELATVVDGARAAAGRVVAPTLVIQSRDDKRIGPAAAAAAFAELGSDDKRLEWTTGAGHVLTVDYGRDHVLAMTADWLEQHTGAAVMRRD